MYLISEVLESDNLHSVIRLVLKTGNYMNAVSVYSGIVELWMTPLFCSSECHFIHLTTGWLCRQCNWLPNGFSVKARGHQSKQTWNESDALCCDGK